MSIRRIIIFGGSGFIGRYLVKYFAENGYIIKIFTRYPEKAKQLKLCGNLGQIEVISGDVTNVQEIENNIFGCHVVVNLLGTLYSTKNSTFYDIHAKAAENIAKAAKSCDVELMVHFSAMGIDEVQQSHYARSKLIGENLVKLAFPNAVIIRPNLVFGAEDRFFNKFAKLTMISPFLPVIGGGRAVFQPIYVDDLAKFVFYIVNNAVTDKLYNVCGPRTYSFKELLNFILSIIKRKNILINIPFSVANILACVCELKIMSIFFKLITGNTDPILTRDQVKFIRGMTESRDMYSTNSLRKAGIKCSTIENIVPKYLEIYKNF
ncbi:complex I NDUFA9 subunit family protein [Ehrlichia canis]|uniref:complex I NDUFA9 subunit family protein n=1 Tax=Ehrlichia canis TaxID=944 RepID=UPI000C84B766|nr:complex I NDUFA9 subunit family protein [Ehrlichia canis]AUO54342.1 complex I NDUFA9 subunit family protein [Ehrlichia canis]UKC53312.1 complex I NDUFA9 subunit family protein [Ehrlichia canis]UKC54249.1 complex I NDUFA9 subunit family protein [Ehrlichia canis]UKC55185.1 complex I NDUFA9 subunit family protein [Ehrlichia canis]